MYNHHPAPAHDIDRCDLATFLYQPARVCALTCRQGHIKKINTISVNPVEEHILATASLDRTVKIWDTRKLAKCKTKTVSYESSLCSHNSAGQQHTSSITVRPPLSAVCAVQCSVCVFSSD